ncbi:MAG: peptidase M19 [Rhodobiaceae bacterium]|nr:MAG: peptidase M19 [Rhodobiaceae bacterium]
MKRILIGFGVLALVAFGLLYFVVPGVFESTINVVEDHDAYEISDETKALHEQLIVADLHSDTLLWGRDPLARGTTGHVDIPRLQEGNVTLQVFSAVTKAPAGQNYDSNTGDSDQITLLVQLQLWPLRTWDSLYERAHYQGERLLAAEQNDPDALRVIKTQADLDTVLTTHESGGNLVGGLLATEGSHALEGDLANIKALHTLGYRMMGLHHFFDNKLGGSLHGISQAGLTDFGKDAVREMERLEIIVDVAHSSPAVVRDTLAIATRPLVVSHTGIQGTCDSPRNLDDDLMRNIAAKGGLIGIGYWEGAVCDHTPASIVKTLRYAIDLLGVDHVALGSDYDGSTSVRFDTSELAVLTEEMRRANFTNEEIGKVMGANIVRFIRNLLPQG